MEKDQPDTEPEKVAELVRHHLLHKTCCSADGPMPLGRGPHSILVSA